MNGNKKTASGISVTGSVGSRMGTTIITIGQLQLTLAELATRQFLNQLRAGNRQISVNTLFTNLKLTEAQAIDLKRELEELIEEKG